MIVKRILRKYGYPPDKQEKATQTVLEQAEVLCYARGGRWREPRRECELVLARIMKSFLEEMQQCKSVKACIELALTDAYGEYEQASAWLACIETILERFDRVRLMGQEVDLQGFDLENELTVVAVCMKGKQRARVGSIQSNFRA